VLDVVLIDSSTGESFIGGQAGPISAQVEQLSADPNTVIVDMKGNKTLQETVNEVQMAIGDAKIGKLTVIDHASPGIMEFGDARLSGVGVQRYLSGQGQLKAKTKANLQAFKQLSGMITATGRVELHGCQVGAGTAGAGLLDGLAQLGGHPVSGSTSHQQALTPSEWGFDGWGEIRTGWPTW
jgi:hypothetical protein